MKLKIILITFFIVIYASANTFACNKQEIFQSKQQTVVVFKYNVVNSSDSEFNSNIEYNGCSIKGDLTVTTADGGSVRVQIEITAATCKEAVAVLSKVMAAFAKK